MNTRFLKNQIFSGLSVGSTVLLAAALLLFLVPMGMRGCSAYVFTDTVEFRKSQMGLFQRGDKTALAKEIDETNLARASVLDAMQTFSRELDEIIEADPERGYALEEDFETLQGLCSQLLGPADPDDRVMVRDKYGCQRWDHALELLSEIQQITEWDYPEGGELGVQVHRPRKPLYEGTGLEPAFDTLFTETHLRAMLLPELTFYPQFLTDKSYDAHLFGGVGPEVLGTIALTVGAMLMAFPVGIASAIYLTEFAGTHGFIGFIRTCIGTLSGVPSIVFGLFGLACFVAEDSPFQVSDGPSVIAGCLTLALLIVPTIIRASEEAIRAVPKSYREAAVGLGAGTLRTSLTVVLPAALPGMITGAIISMGRAAGETAPIIFTAAVSIGQGIDGFGALFTDPTPALSWNLYNLCTEHEAVEQIRHVQYGMAFTLIALVLGLNVTAIALRARVEKKLRGQ